MKEFDEIIRAIEQVEEGLGTIKRLLLSSVKEAKENPETLTDRVRKEIMLSRGARLREARKALGLTLADVASAIGITGGYLSLVERGHADASDSVTEKLEAYFSDVTSPPNELDS